MPSRYIYIQCTSSLQAALPSEQPHAVDTQTYQASTAGELTYGKDKAHDMLKLKRQELMSEADVVLPSHMTSQVLLSPTVLMCFVQ